jgi:hypothetical protein
MKFLQFPWRWLVALSVVACLLAAMAFRRSEQGRSGVAGRPVRWPTIVAGAMIVAMAISGALLFFQPCDDEDAVTAQVAGFRLGSGTEGTDEYTPVAADNAAIQQHLPLVRILRAAQDDTADNTPADNPEWHAGDPGSITARVGVKRSNAEHWVVSVVTPETGFAVLRLMDYPSWRVTVDGTPVAGRPVREDGLMAVPVKAGSHAVDVQWSATRDVVAGREVSAIALLGFAVVVVRERKSNRKCERGGPV